MVHRNLTRQKRPIWQKLLVSLLFTLLCLLFLEGISWLLLRCGLFSPIKTGNLFERNMDKDFDTLWYNHPHSSYEFVYNDTRYCSVTTDVLGFRDDFALSDPKPSNEYRILCLGDSSTFGVTVDQWMTYPSQIQEILNSRTREDGYHYVAINAGCIGFSALQAARLLHKMGDTIKPDMVIISVGVNDARWETVSDHMKDYHDGPLPGVRRALFYSSLYQVLNALLKQSQTPQWDAGKGTIRRESPGEYTRDLSECVQETRRLGAVPVFLPISVPPEYLELMWQVARTENVQLVDAEVSLLRAWRELAAGRKSYAGLTPDIDIPINALLLREWEGTAYDESYQMRKHSYVMDDYIHPNYIGYCAIAEDLARIIP